MRKAIKLLFASTLLVLCACKDGKTADTPQTETIEVSELENLYAMMSGEFSSKEQSERDTTFFNINLVMHPIWENDSETKWLYVEQAVTEYIDRPYRQRVYKLSDQGDGTFESKVYELPGPERFVHAWDDPSLFEKITPDSLVVRDGCAVYLSKDENGCYTGSTRDKECLSSLRGATYATSIVTLCEGQITSWDQGWNAEDVQVWGAEKEGYVFKKKS